MLDCWFDIGVDPEVYGDTRVKVGDCGYAVDAGDAGVNVRLLIWDWSWFWSWY